MFQVLKSDLSVGIFLKVIDAVYTNQSNPGLHVMVGNGNVSVVYSLTSRSPKLRNFNEASLLSMVVVQNLVYFAAGIIGIIAGWLLVSDTLDGEIMGFLTRGLTTPYSHEFLFLLVGGFIVLTLSFASANVYSNVEATLIAPFEYVALPMAIFWGIIFWGDWPDIQAWIGISMILAAGIIVIYRENIKSTETASAAPMRAASVSSIIPYEDEEAES